MGFIGVIAQEILVEPDTFSQGRQGYILVHSVAGFVLGIGHANERKPQGRIRQDLVPTLGICRVGVDIGIFSLFTSTIVAIPRTFQKGTLYPDRH